MAFSATWDTAFEALPPDTGEAAKLGASRIRDLKLAIRERMEIDHSWVGDADDGKHLQVNLLTSASDPTAAAGEGFLYVKDIGAGVIELFYEDAASNVIQLTDGGSPASIPSGSRMTFLQSAVPTGWTQDNTVNDKVMRIVDNTGVGWNTGGSWTISGVTVDGHILSITEIPAHTHNVTFYNVFSGTPGNVAGTPGTSSYGSDATSSVGGGSAHSHGLTADGTWRPAYVDAIVCTKD